MEIQLTNYFTTKMETKNSKRCVCFFCLRHEHPESESENSSSKFHELSFRNLSRYFKLFQYDPKESSSPYCSWFICKQCSQMAAEFNELYHLLEVTKLQLNWCQERMHKIMTSKTMNGTTDTFRSAMLGQVEKSIKPLPQVILCRAKNLKDIQLQRPFSSLSTENKMDIDEPAYSPCPSPELSISVSPVESIKIKMEHDDLETDQETVHSEINNAPEEVLEPVIKYRKRKKKPKDYTPPPQLKCSFCRATFNNREKCGGRFLHQHVVQYHCDQLFPRHKLDIVTVPEFKKICGTLLWKDMVKENEDTNCSYCDKIFPRIGGKKKKHGWFASSVKGHYIQTHYEQIEEKLRIFLSDPNLTKILLQDCDSDSRICECGVYLENFSSRASHSKWHCPLTAKDKQASGKPKGKPPLGPHDATISANFYKPKDSDSTSTLVCKSCKETFATRRNAVRHWKYYCRKGERLEIPEKNTMNCEYCSYKCVDRMWNSKCRMKCHHVCVHPEHFFKEERDSLQQSKWKKKKNFKGILINIMFPKFFSFEGKMNTKCSICGVTYRNQAVHSNLNAVKIHLVNKHKDELKQKLREILEESDESLEEQLDGCHHGNVREMDEGNGFLKRQKQEPSSDNDNDCESNDSNIVT